MSDFDSFFKKMLYKSPDIKELLYAYLGIMNAEDGFMFLCNKNKNKNYNLISSTIENLENLHIHPPEELNDLHICNNGNNLEGLSIDIEVKSLLIIKIKDDNNILGFVVLINHPTNSFNDDISNLYQAICISQLIFKKLIYKNEYNLLYSDASFSSKDIFLANMSHEIRTPLNGIVGYNQIMLQTNLTTTQKSYLENMNQCSIQLMQIINDILDYSKLSNGNMELNNEYFPIKEIQELVHSALYHKMQEKKQTYIFEIDDNITFVKMDKLKLAQIIINLTSNANKFTPIGGVIKTKISKISENLIKVDIIDSGMGISFLDQAKLFNSFTQLSTDEYKPGTGLGLAICKKLCKLLGGDITVDSTVDIGSTFSFTACFEYCDNTYIYSNIDKKLLRNKFVLVVDDIADNRILLTEMLFSIGMRPIVCSTALEAFRMVMSNTYNFCVALIDICMPDVSGVELAKQIKDNKPIIPLIALSSVENWINNTTNFEYKLMKPINNLQLINTIYNIVIRKSYSDAYIGDSSESSEESSEEILHISNTFNRNIKILVVEDITYNRKLLTTMLGSFNYKNVDEAENGSVALEMIKVSASENNPYDVILLDLRMPVMNGHDVINFIKKTYLINPPKIVIVTASILKEDKDLCRKMNVKYFILKPVSLSQLKDVILHVSKI